MSVQWGNLSLLSETQKAQVMGAYAQAIVPLLGNGAISKESAFYFTKELYPEFPAEDAEHFMAGLDETLARPGAESRRDFDMGDLER
ncbi:MAG: hypothetical protein FWG66_14130 [Spirochaetes bacterium]|nr:hypothetical protein [Spirochaetota bacterium]